MITEITLIFLAITSVCICLQLVFLDKSIKNVSDTVNWLHSRHLFEEGKRLEKEKSLQVEIKKHGANYYPRTDAQKLQASQKRKEWWAKKRASEGKGQTTEAPIERVAEN